MPQEPRVIDGWFGGGRPIDRSNPDPSSQELTVDLDVSGGYDKNLGVDELTFAGSDVQYGGVIGVSAFDAQHRWGTRRNSIESSLSGTLRFASLGVRQQFTGRSDVRAHAGLGRRAGAAAAYSIAYEPTYLFNAFGALNLAPPDLARPDGDAPVTTSQDDGITEQRWMGSTASASLDRNWTTRQRSEVDYATSTRKPLTGAGLESHSQAVGFRHEWSPLEHLALHPRYRFTDNLQDTLTALSLPVRMHQAGLDVRWARRMVRNRLLSISLGGGATHTRRELEVGEPSEFVGPSGSVAIRYGAPASWALSFDSSRDVTLLEGLSPEAFTTDAFTLQMMGRLGRHAEVRITGAYSRGTALTSSDGAFETGLGSAEWRYSLSRCCALTVMYMYYDHQFADLAFAPIGFPSRQRRNSIRAGMSFWLPLFGSFQSE